MIHTFPRISLRCHPVVSLHSVNARLELSTACLLFSSVLLHLTVGHACLRHFLACYHYLGTRSLCLGMLSRDCARRRGCYSLSINPQGDDPTRLARSTGKRSRYPDLRDMLG